MKTIEEIMGLVEDAAYAQHSIAVHGSQDWLVEKRDLTMKAIEAALRELVDRKPLSDEYISVIAEKHRFSYSSSGFDFEEFDDIEFCREIERAHNIGV